ncbi:tripartite tricarboxylate transporter TctB family protein [Salipiger sp. 1_MG-2023]|uniref:tripartite tricarboxylate transporter TctB family protein n=1 Tax=Salipiger sp. 1_MG-2023 TaxID=3062665 RepID=UPI0026E1D6A0|nr:tripartite tricarboxylate transporter TctB family protein [Salipiger sp. 1_MG-2023]MDO6585111.1 tripartite tricarboxylate transporter TctB family protein [Salipiger sp. 1_MG-2023]
MKLSDALLGGFFVLLGIAVLWLASQFPSFQGQPYGAALLPSILAVGFILCGAIMMLRELRLRRSAAGGSGPVFALVPDLREGGAPALFAVLGNILAQIWLSPMLGFLPVSVIGLSVLFLVLRLSAIKALLLALATTVVCWWLFVDLLRVPLPRGFLDGVL